MSEISSFSIHEKTIIRKSGVLNKITITFHDGKEVTPMSKDLIDDIPKGTIYRQIAGGGGGFGNSHEREIEKVVMDVRNEVCSFEKAKEDYGVVVNEDFSVNTEKTKKPLRIKKWIIN